MSDRASNEKKADRLLATLRDELPGQCNEHETHPVEHFHCMAHVLLGFHRYMYARTSGIFNQGLFQTLVQLAVMNYPYSGSGRPKELLWKDCC